MRKLIIKAEAPPKKKGKGPAGGDAPPPPKITHGQIYVADRFVGWQEAVLHALQVRRAGEGGLRGPGTLQALGSGATCRNVWPLCSCLGPLGTGPKLKRPSCTLHLGRLLTALPHTCACV